MAKAKKKARKSKPSSSANTGRDKQGKFVKGNSLSVGNVGKSNEHAKALKKAALEETTIEDLKAIWRKMIENAKDGDNCARKELFDRLWGRAIQEVDLGPNDNLQDFINWLVGRNGDSQN